MPLRLLLVDDDGVLAEQLAAALRGYAHEVTVAFHASGALALLKRAPFDAVILDRMLPDIDGMAALNAIRAMGMTIPVIMLTAMSRSAEKVAGLENGADDYVVKPVDIGELNARIAAVLRGRDWMRGSAETLRHGDIVVSPGVYRAWRADRPLELGKLEIRLLAELVRNAGIVLSRAILLERVWDYDFDPRSNIVDVYIRRLRQKLMEAGGTDPIRTVRGAGYTLRE